MEGTFCLAFLFLRFVISTLAWNPSHPGYLSPLSSPFPHTDFPDFRQSHPTFAICGIFECRLPSYLLNIVFTLAGSRLNLHWFPRKGNMGSCLYRTTPRSEVCQECFLQQTSYQDTFIEVKRIKTLEESWLTHCFLNNTFSSPHTNPQTESAPSRVHLFPPLGPSLHPPGIPTASVPPLFDCKHHVGKTEFVLLGIQQYFVQLGKKFICVLTYYFETSSGKLQCMAFSVSSVPGL